MRITAALLSLVAAATLTGAAAQPRVDPAKRAADRIRALQREADELASRAQTLLAELRKLEADRESKAQALAQVQRETDETQRKLAATRERAAALSKTVDVRRPDVEARMVQMYKLGRAGYWRLMLEVDDLRAMGRAYRTAAALTSIDRARVLEHKRLVDELNAERQSLETRAKELAALQVKAAAARTAVERAVAARNGLLASIDQRRDLNAQLVGELQSVQQRLQASVTQLDGRSSTVTLPIRAFRGDLPWPARGAIGQRFGRQVNSRFGTTIVRNGIEISVADGQPVKVVHEGTVAFADAFAGYGNLVIVEHGERSYSLYGYLSGLETAAGQRVEAGTSLGMSGRNPSGVPGLYFELRIDGSAVNPLQWLRP
jgi:septal ring factor EnvC (AmiA/AmiB activator)